MEQQRVRIVNRNIDPYTNEPYDDSRSAPEWYARVRRGRVTRDSAPALRGKNHRGAYFMQTGGKVWRVN